MLPSRPLNIKWRNLRLIANWESQVRDYTCTYTIVDTIDNCGNHLSPYWYVCAECYWMILRYTHREIILTNVAHARVHVCVVLSFSISRTDLRIRTCIAGYSMRSLLEPDRAVIYHRVISGSQMMRSTNIFVAFLAAFSWILTSATQIDEKKKKKD